MRDLEAVTRVAGLTVSLASALALAACTSGRSQSRPPRTRPSTVPAIAHPLSTKLQQTGRDLRFVHPSGANPTAVTVLASRRNLRPGQQGVVLAVRGVGNLMGSCSRGHPAVKFLVTYRGPGSPPVVTEVKESLARPVALYLVALLPPTPPPVGGEQQFAFFQTVGGGESGDFSLAFWATLTPVAGGCAFSANGVLRFRESIGSGFLRRIG